MNCLEAEKKLCLFLAEKTGLVPDHQIFAGAALPPGVPEGVSVSFGTGRTASFNSVSKFQASVRGEFLSRQTRSAVFDALTSALPLYSTQTGFLSVAVDPEALLVISEERSGSGEKFAFELVLAVAFA